MRTDASLLVPIVAVLAAFFICFAALYFRFQVRKLRHSERLAAIEKGIELPEEGPGRMVWLLRGLVWIAGGVGIIVVLTGLHVAHGDRATLGTATLGIIPLTVGGAHLLAYRLAGRRRRAN